MQLTPYQTERIETILKQWHEARRAEFERDYSNLKYDSPQYAKTYRVGGKYVHLLDGTSGAFMVEIETGIDQGMGNTQQKEDCRRSMEAYFPRRAAS